MSTELDLEGMIFGRLLAIRPVGMKPRRWECSCECGKTTNVETNSLMSGRTVSCGCFRKEAMKRGRDKLHRTLPKHGLSGIPEYDIWRGMMRRCESQDFRSYARYGGRGIAVCAEWHSFERFLHDMGRRPSVQHSIDRIDNDGNYEPGNCRWATNAEQARNRPDFKGGMSHLTRKQLLEKTCILFRVADAARGMLRWWDEDMATDGPVTALRESLSRLDAAPGTQEEP